MSTFSTSTLHSITRSNFLLFLILSPLSKVSRVVPYKLPTTSILKHPSSCISVHSQPAYTYTPIYTTSSTIFTNIHHPQPPLTPFLHYHILLYITIKPTPFTLITSLTTIYTFQPSTPTTTPITCTHYYTRTHHLHLH